MTTTSDTLSAFRGSAAHAVRVLAAQERLRTVLGDGLASDFALDMLLFLFARDGGEGVPTSLCCAAVSVPRTTALRWINALVAGRLVTQQPHGTDRRITLLKLAPSARSALTDWLCAIAQDQSAERG